MTTRTTNKNARVYVQNKEPFLGSHIFSSNELNLYIVYSYGEHFPLFIYDYPNHQWLENDDSYSRTTARHRAQLRPTPNTLKCTTEQMQAVIRAGSITGIIQEPN